MQTHEWEALLDGTTPGPWKFEEHDVWENTAGLEYPAEQVELEHSVQGENGNHLFGAFNNYTMIEHPGNLPLAAAAPEAVAEVIRLRKAIEAVRDDYRRSAEADRWLSQFSIAPLEPVFNDLADDLTRILEGDTDE